MTVVDRIGMIDHIESLPPLPAIVQRILSVTNSSDSSIEDVVRVLSEDQAFAAKILRVANSSFLGAGRQVAQVSRAVMLLGLVGVRNVVLGIATRDAIQSGATPPPEHAILWRHSIAVASASEAIARSVGFKPPEEAFVTALLHDIGQLAMVTFAPESFQTVFREQERGVGFLSVEREHFGLDHTEAGFEILTRWGLPEQVCEVVRLHHEREINQEEPASRLLAIVMHADTIAQVMGFGFDMPAGSQHRAELSASYLGLSDAEELHVLDGLNARIDQAVEMFAGVDSAEDREDTPSCKRTIWVSFGKETHACISHLLLEHGGYEVLSVPSAEVIKKRSPGDLVIIVASDGDGVEDLVSELVQDRHRNIMLLSDQAGGALTRRRDTDTGVFHLARVFTAFDIRWIEEHVHHV